MRRNRCYNGGNKHKFEARYTIKAPPLFKGKNMLPEIIKAFRGREYIYDVCVWCGKIIKLEDKKHE